MAERSARGVREAPKRRQQAPRLTLYNTLSRTKKPFAPLKPGRVSIYTCGPTVYRHAHIGNLRSYLMAFRHEILREIGLLDEKFRFYRHLDLDFSFAVRSRGYRAVVATELPLRRHEHVDWERTPPEERDRLSKRNFYRFLHKWGDRTDLIVSARL